MSSQPQNGNRERVLLVDPDAATREALEQLIRNWGYTVDTAADGDEALQKIAVHGSGIVVTDLMMPGMSGIDLMLKLREQTHDIAAVILTAHGTIETAVEAIKQGAYDYLIRPDDFHRLKVTLDNGAERQRMLREIKTLRRHLRDNGRFGELVGNDAAMQRIYETIAQAAPTNASILISGESGTGKELVARAVHRLSPRSSRSFVPINCAAIPETLLESELFGHEKGAFTGAFERQEGCFELANHGTLLLDEVAEMTSATQVKLLRVLQERSFRRVGGRMEQPADVRVIAATNADPVEAVAEGRLREDLYYRLNVFAVRLPALRDRMEDLPLLIQAFLVEFNERNGKTIEGVDDAVMELFEQYRWPGNVRELRNVIERATIVAGGPSIGPEHVPVLGERSRGDGGLTPGMTVQDVERQLIVRTIEYTGGNKTRAAKMLGITAKTLHNKLKSFGVAVREEEGAS